MQEIFDGTFAGMRVLITGHTGFKGSWLGIWLQELGAQVTGYSLDPPTNPSNFELCGLERRVRHVKGDVRDLSKLRQTIQECQPEAVFHLAAQPVVLASYREPKETFDTNVTGVVNVLEAIRQTQSVKAFVGVTSDKVYEDRDWLWGYRENDALGGYDPYSASKAMAELAIQSYRRSWSQRWSEASMERCFSKRPVAIASARAGNVIGGGDFAPYRLIPDCMKALKERTPLTVRSPGSVRHWEHVLEPLSGYLWLAVNLLGEADLSPSPGEHCTTGRFSEAWNFGPLEHEPITCETLVRKAADLWGSSVPILTGNASGAHETQLLRVNWDKAANRLAWRPVYTWEEALAETVDWWKEYQRRLSRGPAVDMYPVCVEHIRQYAGRARELGIRWATPS